MLQRTLYAHTSAGTKSISLFAPLTPDRFHGVIKKTKALWKALRKVAVPFRLSHSPAASADGMEVSSECS
ncbi:hypothetical protein BQ8482_110485 [Mesorhizobium delmotii]|uniref:Uncharacterized protein n=1 Tax=Mesorhizobium delmotii TaxID=1631247 RepID=A0A2P9ABN3_9HYPH|nr:hypothetical protein BQ8482_110485 [Mesorhizobium delmotii]